VSAKSGLAPEILQPTPEKSSPAPISETLSRKYLAGGRISIFERVNYRPYRRLQSLLGETMARLKTSRLGSLRYFCLPLLKK